MHKLAFCLRAGLRLSFQLTLDAGVFQDKNQSRGSRTIVCHECTCIRSVYKYLSVQKSKFIVSTWLQSDFAPSLLCTFPRLTLLSMAQQYIVFLPASLGVAPTLLQLEYFWVWHVFFFFIYRKKIWSKYVDSASMLIVGVSSRKNALTFPHLWIWAAVYLCFLSVVSRRWGLSVCHRP